MLAETRAAFAVEQSRIQGQMAVIDGGDRILVFERIVPIIHAHGGHIDNYVGDGWLAVFRAPRRQGDHADQTLVASLEIAAPVEQEFEDQLSIGVGLNSGLVVAGNVGGAGRLELSVTGDAVNVAARVESATREIGDTVLVSQHTRALLAVAAAASLEGRPALPLKGKTHSVSLFAPKAAAGSGRRDAHVSYGPTAASPRARPCR